MIFVCIVYFVLLRSFADSRGEDNTGSEGRNYGMNVDGRRVAGPVNTTYHVHQKKSTRRSLREMVIACDAKRARRQLKR